MIKFYKLNDMTCILVENNNNSINIWELYITKKISVKTPIKSVTTNKKPEDESNNSVG